MYPYASPFYSVIAFLIQLLQLLQVLLIIRIVVSWISPGASPDQQPYKILYMLTEPVMAPFRQLIPPMAGMDFSPMVLFIVIGLLQGFLASMLHF